MPGKGKKARLFLIDGMALAYRSYFAFIRNPLTNSKGENVSAVYGFTNIILNTLDNEKPEYFAVVFDTKEPTFRHELYKEYKAQRAEMPRDMIDQLPRIHEMLDILQVPSISKPGFEADDIIGTLAKQAEKPVCGTCGGSMEIEYGEVPAFSKGNPPRKLTHPCPDCNKPKGDS